VKKDVSQDNMNVNLVIQIVMNAMETKKINVQNVMDKKDYMKEDAKINALQEHL